MEPAITFSKQHRVFVGGIAPHANEAALTDYFSAFGRVIECKIVMDPETAKSRGFAFVTFEDAEVAERVRQCGLLYYLGKLMNTGEVQRSMRLPAAGASAANGTGDNGAGATAAAVAGEPQQQPQPSPPVQTTARDK